MADEFDVGAPGFGVHDGKAARRISAGVYEALSDMMSIEMADTELQLIGALGKGDDKITVAVSVIEGALMNARLTGCNPSTIAVMTGKSITTLATVNQLQFIGGEHLPYFGVAVKQRSADGGNMWVWLPMCKIMNNFKVFQAEYGKLGTTDLSIQVIACPTWGLSNNIMYPGDVDITVFPPLNIAEVA